MGLVSKRTGDDESGQLRGASGQGLWLEHCTACGTPMTVLAPTRPARPVCAACAPSAGRDHAADGEG